MEVSTKPCYFAAIGGIFAPGNNLAEQSVIDITRRLAKSGYYLRSGHEEGFQQLVESVYVIEHLSNKMSIHLPWEGFRNSIHRNYVSSLEVQRFTDETSIRLNLSTNERTVRQLMYAITRTILGDNLNDPVGFVIYYSRTHLPNVTQSLYALSLCRDKGIPVYSLSDSVTRQRLENFQLLIDERLGIQTG